MISDAERRLALEAVSQALGIGIRAMISDAERRLAPRIRRKADVAGRECNDL